jgi:hypothetical protein
MNHGYASKTTIYVETFMNFQDLQKFLDEAKDGVIYFSLGNNVRSDLLSEEKGLAFIEAFCELPQKILWKWDLASLPGQQANVKIGTWLPQQDILGNMTLYMIGYIDNCEQASAVSVTGRINFLAKGSNTLLVIHRTHVVKYHRLV